MTWWTWAIGFVFAVLLYVRLRRGRAATSTNLLAGSVRDMGGRGGF